MTYKDLCRKLNDLAHTVNIRPFRPHVLRHTAATMYATGGLGSEPLDISLVARILGNDPVVAEYYVHVTLDELREVLGRSSNVRLVEEEILRTPGPQRIAVSLRRNA